MIDVKRDVRLVPYSPVRLCDPFEVRFQAKGTGKEIHLSVYLDEDGKSASLLKECSAYVPEGRYAFLRFYCLKASEILEEGRHILYFHADGDTAELAFEAVSERKVVLDGGFIMFGPPNDRTACDLWREQLKKMTDEDWRRYICDMHGIGQSCIIVNAAVQLLSISNKEYGAHYPSKLVKKSDITADDPLEAVLQTADQLRMNVFIGIGNNYGGNAELKDWELDEKVLEEVYTGYGHHASLYGWYIARECNLCHPFENYMKGAPLLYKRAQELSPVLPFLISPYIVNEGDSNMEEGLNRFWELGFDIFMPQDMMGQRFNQELVTVAQSRVFHEKARHACDTAGRHFWGNNEAFNFTEDGKYLVPRYLGGGVFGEEGFIEQIRAVDPFVEKRMNFMDSAFFTPAHTQNLPGGEAAVKQYEDYIKYYEAEVSK